MDTEIRLVKVEVEVTTLKEFLSGATQTLSEVAKLTATHTQAISALQLKVDENTQAIKALQHKTEGLTLAVLTSERAMEERTLAIRALEQKAEAHTTAIRALERTPEENSIAITESDARMCRKFDEQQTWMDAGFAELQKMMRSHFRWILGTFLGGYFFVLVLMGRIAGLY